ncbi:hypothetical protein D4764_20G0006180 [Takifugu flavidus]|uniref:Uncharacterized protein n=1 Tax=Takifugu flavidus TaxID=433684 RepID=A0A5C6NHP5_9TELE|nr:hypothetical protein D4764_20G0006180 [Takifugu flavidus]
MVPENRPEPLKSFYQEPKQMEDATTSSGVPVTIVTEPESGSVLKVLYKGDWLAEDRSKPGPGAAAAEAESVQTFVSNVA